MFNYLRTNEKPGLRYLNLFLSATLILITLLLLLHCHPAFPAPDRAQSGVLLRATAELGRGETGGNNKGPDIKRYMLGRDGLPWCAGFVSYCLKQAGTSYPYTLRARDFLKYGRVSSTPHPGDVLVMSRDGGGGHVAIVETVTQHYITTIEGNRGDFPAKVMRVRYRRNNIKNLLGFVTIEQKQLAKAN